MSDINDGPMWKCLELSNEIISTIEQIYKFHHQRNNENLRDILQTTEKLKNVLSFFSSKQPKNTAFDFFVSGIKLTLAELNKNLQNFEIDMLTAEFMQWELNILRQDLLLSYRIDQLSAIFPNSLQSHEISNLILDKSAVAFWTHNFSKDVVILFNKRTIFEFFLNLLWDFQIISSNFFSFFFFLNFENIENRIY